MSKRLVVVLAGITCLGMVAAPTAASAAAITMTFDCQVFPASDVCTPGGTYGTLTLTDSLVDPNRVDIEWNLTPPWGVNIERVLLNFDTVLTNHSLFVVAQDAALGATEKITGVTSLFGDNSQPQGNTYAFDIRVNEASPSGLTFSGSLALRSKIGDKPFFDLSITNFLTTSENTKGATPPLYALFSTIQGPAVPGEWTPSNGSEFWGGVALTPRVQELSSVPEPAALLLLGTGFAGIAAWRRRAARR